MILIQYRLGGGIHFFGHEKKYNLAVPERQNQKNLKNTVKQDITPE